MLNRIKTFLETGNLGSGAQHDGPSSHSHEEHQIAAAVLLIEAARADAIDHDEEFRTITRLIREKFGLSDAETESLIEAASERQTRAVELHAFTHQIKTKFSEEERIHLIEMLWEVVYADGHLDDYEANLLRRIAGLIHVSDRERGNARRRVLDKLGIDIK